MNETNSNDLLGCPFCGGEARLITDGDAANDCVACNDCNCAVETDFDEDGNIVGGYATQKWNRRVT